MTAVKLLMTSRGLSVVGYFSLLAFLMCGNANAGRYVPIKVKLNGKVILEGNASDDGTRDVDAVWEELKFVDLRQTQSFPSPKIEQEMKELQLRSDGHLPLQIEVKYGGIATSNVLTIERVRLTSSGVAWRIASADVDRLFESRMIARSDAARLTNPKFSK